MSVKKCDMRREIVWEEWGGLNVSAVSMFIFSSCTVVKAVTNVWLTGVLSCWLVAQKYNKSPQGSILSHPKSQYLQCQDLFCTTIFCCSSSSWNSYWLFRFFWDLQKNHSLSKMITKSIFLPKQPHATLTCSLTLYYHTQS